MLRNLIGAVGALFVLSSAASATVLHITGVSNHQANEFHTTGFFLPQGNCHYTCGEYVEVADGSASGFWFTETGKIRITMDLKGGGVAEGRGWLDLDNPMDGNVGEMNVKIWDSANGVDGDYQFFFRDWLYNADAGVQGINGARLALLGVAGDTSWGDNGRFTSGELGVAMRANIEAVPVPPAIALMLAGLGGLGFMGARRKKRAA